MPKLAGSNRSDCQMIPEAMQAEYRYATENIHDHFIILFGGLWTLWVIFWTAVGGQELRCRQALLPVVLLIPS